MATTAGTLRTELTADSTKFTKELKKAGKHTGDFKKSVGGLSSALGGLKGALAGLISAGALIGFTKNTLSAFDAIGKFADRIGLTTDDLQKYRFAFDKAGVGHEKLDQALLTFEKRLGKARQGIGALAGGLKGGQEELLKTVLATNSASESINVIFDSMRNAENQAQRLAIADAAFGGTGLQMTAAFVDGGKAFDGWIGKAEEMGLIIDENLIRSAEALNDQLSVLGQAIETNFQVGFISPFVDEFGKFAEEINSAEFQEGIKLIGTVLGEFIKFMVVNAKPIAITSASLAALFLAMKLGTALGLKKNIAAITALVAAITAGALAFNELADAQERASQKGALPAGPAVNLEMSQETKGTGIEGTGDSVLSAREELGGFRAQFFAFVGEVEERQSNPLQNFFAAAVQGMNAYGESAGTVSEQIAGSFQSRFKGMEDALVEFVKTGKLEFSSLADSIINDLIRIAVQQAITGALNLATGWIGSLFGFAHGGSFTVGGGGGIDSQLVAFNATPGERVTVETPGQQGRSGINITQNISIMPGIAQTVRAEMLTMLPIIKSETLAGVVDAQSRNGTGGAF